eukprot:CAMPEP_0202889908 /NCGR_PEP_ID=MMETSP1392-20130828/446_1 /ASSEMBLY_ACC=CAM_ASM_000868 /TAXON_ID=225041 /ORGANISM="Chlamydomonas chlamydogama, Strain SAG 11-48b" /LENGTH=86 /DNA_ID=CAMNT_0049573347 /DNA_START=1881 /DNA_END=2141 /DNA_ORIENTATION=-
MPVAHQQVRTARPVLVLVQGSNGQQQEALPDEQQSAGWVLLRVQLEGGLGEHLGALVPEQGDVDLGVHVSRGVHAWALALVGEARS